VTGCGAVPQHPAARRFGARKLLRRAAASFAALVVGACTTVPPTPPGTSDVLSGRLALRVEAIGNAAPRAFSAAFDLRGDPQSGTLGLSTPLGTKLAEARWSPREVVLATPQETRRFDTLDALTQEALGESVPIEAWFDWLRGRPWPGAPSTSSEVSPASFDQLGWHVDLGRFAEGTIAATRESPPPTVTVRIRLDRT
jgi:outer membrane lipoprotein LolB